MGRDPSKGCLVAAV